MKKITLIIFLLIAGTTFANDTVKVFTKIVDYGKITQIKYECVVFSNGDTICKEQGKGSSQGQSDTTEIIAELNNIQKVYKELYESKVKELETKDTDLLRLQGIILYLNSKLEAERKKK